MGIAGALALLWVVRWWRRRRALRAPFPAAWAATLERWVQPYRYLPPSLQAELEQQVKMFLFHKTFVGSGGLEMTDEIRVTIAGQACLLLLNRKSNEYDALRWIYVYPAAFLAKRELQDEAGVVSHGSVGLLGESWSNGKVILSWDDVERGAEDFTDGHNVVLHEFAHQLDHETGSTNGAPVLRGGAPAYKTWSTVFAREFAELQRQVHSGKRTLLDAYGATNEAEFFAVATETFFEKPRAMQADHPQLYQQLANYYQLDPVEWRERR